MGKFELMGERLKEERERLELTQTAFAAIGGATRKTQFNYETGERVPDGAYLAAIAEAGADVLYILTGERSRPVPPTYDQPPEERALLSDYRTTDAQGKALIRAAASTAARAVHANPTASSARSLRVRRRAV